MSELNSTEYEVLDEQINRLRSISNQLKVEYQNLLSLIAPKVDRVTFDKWILFFESEIARVDKTILDFTEQVIDVNLSGTANQIKVEDNIVSFEDNVVFPNDIVGKDFVNTRSGSITRDIDGKITSISKTGGRTITINRDVDGNITSSTDGTRTWTYNRDINNQIESWTISF